MPAIALGTSSYSRPSAAQAPVVMGNLFTEVDPTNAVTGKVYIQRPGLKPLVQLGGVTTRGIKQQDGVFGGDMVVVVDTTFRRVQVDGTIVFSTAFPAGGFVQTTFGTGRSISIGTDGTAWSFDGSTLVQVNMPGAVSAAWSAYIDGYFLIGQGGGSQRVFYLAPGDVDPDALSFFSAESQPDGTVTGQALADDMWIFGNSSIEVWSPSGNLDAPFTRSTRLYSKGCASRDAVCVIDNTIFWPGLDRIVYRADTVPVRISDNTVEERLRNEVGPAMRGWTFSRDGHVFYVLTIGAQGTFVYDVSQQNWPNWYSYGLTYWHAHVGCQIDGRTVLAGDSASGQIWTVDSTVSNDQGGGSGDQPIIRELSGFVPVVTQNQRCNSIELVGSRGRGTSFQRPVSIEFSWSDDEGETMAPWRKMSFGARGQYGVNLKAKGLGRMSAPGRIFFFRQSDDSIFRISYARVNEAMN